MNCDHNPSLSNSSRVAWRLEGMCRAADGDNLDGTFSQPQATIHIQRPPQF
jgi:hypothetical protein